MINILDLLKVKLPREVIKLSPISSAIITHRMSDGRLSKTGYVKLSTFSQVVFMTLQVISRARMAIRSSPHCIKNNDFMCPNMTDCCSGDGEHSSGNGKSGCTVIHTRFAE